MTDQLNIQLSAFVDDALSAEESELLVRRLCRDPQLRETMARYALIGDIVRGGDKAAAPAEFARRVMMAVDGQPMPAPEPAPVRGHQRRQIGFAVAASAVLAAVALMTLPGRAPTPDSAPAQLAEVEAPPVPVVPVAKFDETAPQRPAVIVDRRLSDTDARLNNYLVQHASATGASRGAIAFRNVGFVTEKEPGR